MTADEKERARALFEYCENVKSLRVVVYQLTQVMSYDALLNLFWIYAYGYHLYVSSIPPKVKNGRLINSSLVLTPDEESDLRDRLTRELGAAATYTPPPPPPPPRPWAEIWWAARLLLMGIAAFTLVWWSVNHVPVPPQTGEKEILTQQPRSP